MAYTRNYSEDHYFETVSRRAGTGNPNWTTVNSGVTKVTFSGSRSGSRMPDWKEKIRNGENATTAYTLDRSKLTVRESGALQNYALAPVVGGKQSWIAESFEGFIQPEYTNLIHRNTNTALAEATALKSIYKKIESTLSQLNGSAVIAEGLDVIRQFGAPFSAIVDLSQRHLNRLYLESRGLSGSTSFRKLKWAQIVAATYLEYAFGLAPLISDTKKVAEAFARWQFEVTEDFRPRTKAVGRGVSISSDLTSAIQVVPSMYGLVVNNNVRTTTEHRVQYVVGLRATPTAAFGSNDRLIQLLGFEPRQWVPAIWEAIPWSWLVDYFSNVQDILAASVTSQAGITWLSKTVVQKTTREQLSPLNLPASQARAATGYGYSAQFSAWGHGGKTTRVRTTLTRSIPASLGVPPLTVSFPTDVQKYVNMAAVLLSRRESSSALWLF